MFAVLCLALLAALSLLLARAVAGPTVFDRLLASNTIGTVAVSIVYGLLNIVGTIAVLKFFRHGSLGE